MPPHKSWQNDRPHPQSRRLSLRQLRRNRSRGIAPPPPSRAQTTGRIPQTRLPKTPRLRRLCTSYRFSPSPKVRLRTTRHTASQLLRLENRSAEHDIRNGNGGLLTCLHLGIQPPVLSTSLTLPRRPGKDRYTTKLLPLGLRRLQSRRCGLGCLHRSQDTGPASIRQEIHQLQGQRQCGILRRTQGRIRRWANESTTECFFWSPST